MRKEIIKKNEMVASYAKRNFMIPKFGACHEHVTAYLTPYRHRVKKKKKLKSNGTNFNVIF